MNLKFWVILVIIWILWIFSEYVSLEVKSWFVCILLFVELLEGGDFDMILIMFDYKFFVRFLFKLLLFFVRVFFVRVIVVKSVYFSFFIVGWDSLWYILVIITYVVFKVLIFWIFRECFILCLKFFFLFCKFCFVGLYLVIKGLIFICIL